MLRDIDGLTGSEVCDVLEISDANQRVLLHRGRSHLRQALEAEIGGNMRLLGRREDLVCQQVVELVTDYLEGALSRSERRRFEAHLADCEHCTEYLEQMRATIRLTGRLQAEDLTPEMREEFSTLYRRWRDGAD